jgi:hypothetical protein
VRVDEMVVKGTTVGVVRIDRANSVVLTESGAFLQVGDQIRAMTAEEIARRLSDSAQRPDYGMLANAIASQTGVIEQLRAEVRAANSWRSKLKDYFLGGVIGALVGLLVTFLAS